MSQQPVEDWATDYDIFDRDYVTDPAPDLGRPPESLPGGPHRALGRFLDADPLRGRPALAHDTEPSLGRAARGDTGGARSRRRLLGVKAPPITSDPPEHALARRLILPVLLPGGGGRPRALHPRSCAHRLIDAFAGRGRADAAVEYAQQIPPRVIADLLGVDPARPTTSSSWVRGLLEHGLKDPAARLEARHNILAFFSEQVAQRRAEPRDDFISQLLAGDLDGEPVPDAPRRRHLQPAAGRRHRHHLELHRLRAVAPGVPPRRPPAPRRRTRADPHRGGGVPPGLLARHHGPGGARGGRGGRGHVPAR